MDKTTFCHVFMSDTKTTYGIMTQLHKYNIDNAHRFIILDTEECVNRFPLLQNFDDLVFVPDFKKNKWIRIYRFLKIEFSKSDIIIFHSLFFGSVNYLYILFLWKKLFDKLVWIEWGADLYLYEYKNDSMKHRALNRINKRIRDRVKYCGVTFPIDEEILISSFPGVKKCFYTPMPNPRSGPDELIKYIQSIKIEKKDNCIRILCGHNAYTFNNHIFLFDLLKRYKNDDVEIIVPINYGEYGINGQFGGKYYCDAIEKYAGTVFGNKAIVIRDKIPFDEYIKVLWNIDIAIFDFDRPCGLGTLRILALMNKKIFLPKGSPYYDFLISKDIPICDTNEICKMSFDDFVTPVNYNNVDWILDYMNNDKDMEYWNKMFAELELDL